MRLFSLLLVWFGVSACTSIAPSERTVTEELGARNHRHPPHGDDEDEDDECPATPKATPDPHLAGAWYFDEADGQVAFDASPNANHGLLGGNTASDLHDPIRRTHPSGRHLDFTGEQFVRIERSAALEAPHVSVEAWVKRTLDPAAPPYYEYVVGKGVKDCYAASYSLVTSATWGLVFHLSENGNAGWRQSPDPGPGIWDGQWHHVVGTFDGAVVRLFVDGAEVGSGTPVPFAIGYETPQDGSLYIGDYSSTAPCGNDFRGSIDDVRVWSRALQPGEVSALAPGTPD